MTGIPLITAGGTPGQQVLHLAPANGFVLETYQPLLLSGFFGFHCVAVPPRALWQHSPPPVQPETDWYEDAALMLKGMDEHFMPPVVAVGHSFGAIVTLIAALQEPERFRALILLDPTILVREAIDYVSDLRRQGHALENPLSQSALRRRRTFASIEGAYANFRSKPVFGQWSDEAIKLYAEYGTREIVGGRALTWSPEWEAYYFSTIPADTWDMVYRLPELKIPMLFLRGETSDTYTEASAAEVAHILPHATHKQIHAHGHLFPQSAPNVAARQIRTWLKQQKLI
jgi:pimeloyl-ACP methyl ester carboxylesterase